jgi:hypothetical protein
MLVEVAGGRPVVAPIEVELHGRDPRNWIDDQTENNKMQLSSHGENGGSQLILVFSVPNGD